MSKHPLYQFQYCPICGAKEFEINDEKSKKCKSCGFVYYFNPSAAVAAFIRNDQHQLLLVKRANNPAKGTLDLPGGFTDLHETAEEAIAREIKEETGLVINNCHYLFSYPNIYPYNGFNVHTVDLFFECHVTSFEGVQPADDAAEIIILPEDQLKPAEFGLHSISKAVNQYISSPKNVVEK